MIDYLTYYYDKATVPFRCITDLPDEAALRIMKELFAKNRDNILFERFRNPEDYLRQRLETEAWVRSAFVGKGGRPVASHPISMVLGRSKWIEANAPNQQKHGEIRIPMTAFSENDVSFTFPDSMVSRWLGTAQPEEYYLAELHGKVFTWAEISEVIAAKGLPEEGWQIALPPDTGAYVEAQVWNREPLERIWSESCNSALFQ